MRYSEGQLVPRLFVFQEDGRPQLSEGGLPGRMQLFERGATEAFGTEDIAWDSIESLESHGDGHLYI